MRGEFCNMNVSSPGRYYTHRWLLHCVGPTISIVLALLVAGCQATAPSGPADNWEAGAQTADGQIMQSMLAAAGNSERVGDWNGAAQYWQNLLQRDPGNVEYVTHFGDALRRAGRQDEAVSVLRLAVQDHPSSPEVAASLGKALMVAGYERDAVAELRRASTMDAGVWETQSALGIALGMLGEAAIAEQHHRQALELAPDNPVAANNLALHLAATGNVPGGLNVMRQAASKPTADRYIRLNLALLLALSGEFSEARDIVNAELPQKEAAVVLKLLETATPSDLLAVQSAEGVAVIAVETLPTPNSGSVAFAEVNPVTDLSVASIDPEAAQMPEVGLAEDAFPEPPAERPASALSQTDVAAPASGIESPALPPGWNTSPSDEEETVIGLGPEEESGAEIMGEEPVALELPTQADFWSVQFASLPDRPSAERLRAELVVVHSDLLSADAWFIRSKALGDLIVWRIFAGMFGSRDEADTLCEEVQRKGGDCIVFKHTNSDG